MASTPGTRLTSRAVLRVVQAGTRSMCPHCNAVVMFQAKKKHNQIIANVYKRGRWDRVEHWHPDCYVEAGQPYGEPSQ